MLMEILNSPSNNCIASSTVELIFRTILNEIYLFCDLYLGIPLVHGFMHPQKQVSDVFTKLIVNDSLQLQSTIIITITDCIIKILSWKHDTHHYLYALLRILKAVYIGKRNIHAESGKSLWHQLHYHFPIIYVPNAENFAG